MKVIFLSLGGGNEGKEGSSDRKGVWGKGVVTLHRDRHNPEGKAKESRCYGGLR